MLTDTYKMDCEKFNEMLVPVLDNCLARILATDDGDQLAGKVANSYLETRIRQLVNYHNSNKMEVYFGLIFIIDCRSCMLIDGRTRNSKTIDIVDTNNTIGAKIDDDINDDENDHSYGTEPMDPSVYALAWAVQLICQAILVTDDIIDNSADRDGKPCWHTLVIDGYLIYFFKLIHTKKNKCLTIIPVNHYI